MSAAQTWDDSPSAGAPEWIAWLETGVLSALLPGAGLLLHRGDPFFLRGRFPWLVVPPLLLALRHGSHKGLCSVLLLSAAMYLGAQQRWPAIGAFPGVLCAGMLLSTLVAGEFCDMWLRRIRRLEAHGHHLRLRLAHFTRAHHILTLSYEALERRLLGDPQSLRDALQQVRHNMLEASSAAGPFAGQGDLIMDIFAGFGWIQVAALYPMAGPAIGRAAALLGQPPPLDEQDPVLRTMLETRQLATVRDSAEERPEEREGHPGLLVAIPLADIHGRLFGVLAVHEMTFAAFSEDHLSMLALLGGAIGDILALSGGAGTEFHLRLLRCVADAQQHGVPAVLLAMVIDRRRAPEALLEALLEERRGLDQEWVVQDRTGAPVLLLLMPLTDEQGLSGFVSRLEALVAHRYGASLDEVGLRLHSRMLRRTRGWHRRPHRRPPIAQDLLADLLMECQVDAA